MDLFIYRRTTVSDTLLGSGEKAMEDTNVASMELAFQWHGKMSQKGSILEKKYVAKCQLVTFSPTCGYVKKRSFLHQSS